MQAELGGGQGGDGFHPRVLGGNWISSPLTRYLGAPLVPQLTKNPPAKQETLVRFLGQEDPLEKG